MKTSKEFWERLQNDETFAKEIGEKIKPQIDAGEEDYKKIWIPLAAEYGYELTGEELDEMNEKAKAEISDEELGKVAGGTSPVVVIGYTIIATLSAIATAKVSAEAAKNGKNK